MQVFVLEGRIDYEGGCVLGVYSTREAAEAAARADYRGVSHMSYVVHEVGVDAPADARHQVADEDYVYVAA